VRLIPISYGIGYVVGLSVAWVRTQLRGTTLREEAEELPQRCGLVCAVLYTAILVTGLLGLL
jgi:hypothetical protein